MLQLIRDRATGWIAWVIVILISIPFALWGVQEYVQTDTNPTVLVVNGQEIEYNEFYRAYQRRLSAVRRFAGSSEIDEAEVRQQSIDDLVNEQLLLQAALEGGMRVGDELLASAIRSNPRFQDAGNFSQERYEGFLRVNNLSPGGFEFDLRRNIVSQQLLSAVAQTEVVSKLEVQQAVERASELRNYVSLTVPASRFADQTPSEEKMKAYFDKNQEQFRIPERVEIEYLELSRGAIAQGLDAPEDELRELYRSRTESGAFKTGEQRAARHILVSLSNDASDEDAETARKKIAELRQRITAGEDFSEIAKAHSDDPGSKEVGGDLGLFGRGVMDGAFETTAFSLEKGQLSEPVRSRFGWHLIEVTEVQPETQQPFEDVLQELKTDYTMSQAEVVFGDRAELLANLSFEHPDTLAVAADQLGLPIKRSGPFSRDGDESVQGAGSLAVVREHAFRALVLDGDNSDLISTAEDTVVVLRLAQRTPSRVPEFAEVKDQVMAAMVAVTATEAAAKLGAEIVQRLESGEDRDAVATEYELKWSEPVAARRGSGAGTERVRDRLFKMPAHEAKVTFDGFESVEGGEEPRVEASDFTIVALLEVAGGVLDDEAVQRSLQETMRQRIQLELGAEAREALIEALREAAEIEIFEDRLSSGAG